MIYSALSQLLSYSIAIWLFLIIIAFFAAWQFHVPGIILGHVVVAIIIAMLDVQWIQSEMHKPGWNGQPDQDFIFMIGVVLRILLINTVLLPISFIGWCLRAHKVSRK
jgi:hypothetical protein